MTRIMGTKALALLFMGLAMTNLAEGQEQAGNSRDLEATDPDGTLYTLTLLYGAEGDPRAYMRDLFTPVCQTGKCKPVSIRLYWDLLGNYLRYELPEGMLLTKLDHQPFTREDHAKFDRILADPYSVLAELEMEELEGDREKANVDELDAVTGATPKSIENAIVSGAVYTCFTIWHFVYDKTPEDIRAISASMANADFLGYMLQHPNHNYRDWAVARIMEHPKAYPELLTKTLAFMQGDNIFLKRYLLRVATPEVLALPKTQSLLWEGYGEQPYAVQEQVLSRYAGASLPDSLLPLLEKYALAGNTAQFRQLVGLIAGVEGSRENKEARLRRILDAAPPDKSKYAQEALKKLMEEERSSPSGQG